MATATAVGAVAPQMFSSPLPSSPKVGVIGCGWLGKELMLSLRKEADARVVSLCDPNSNMLNEAINQLQESGGPVPKTFGDFRDMLSSDKHDIVVVATPDHWHALPAIEAMKAGADLYLEKPISVDVMEGEAILAAARKYDRVVQVNLQARSIVQNDIIRKKYLDTGRLGKIAKVQTLYYGGGWRRKKWVETAVPEFLDFDTWTGPAPKLPYLIGDNSTNWRPFMEYGNGTIGDMAVHIFDRARFLLDLGWPEAVYATGGIYVHKDATPNIADTQKAIFQYPDIEVSWEFQDWGKSPIEAQHWTDQWGIWIHGSEGSLYITHLKYIFYPKGKGEPEGSHSLSPNGALENPDFSKFNAEFDKIAHSHTRNFLEARKTRIRPISDVEQGHISSACCILANISMQLGRSVAYDPIAKAVRGDQEATELLARSYRRPWKHPDPFNV